MDLRIILQVSVEFLLCEGDVFIIQLIVDVKRHRQHGYSQRLCAVLRDPAVAVSKDRDLFSHTHFPIDYCCCCLHADMAQQTHGYSTAVYRHLISVSENEFERYQERPNCAMQL